MTSDLHYLRLFPLSMVLFPGISVPLHIFEERYRQLVRECLDAGDPFGIVLAHDDKEVAGVPQPHSVGTTAIITDVRALEDGRMNIIVRGDMRFRILDLVTGQPYLGAYVEYLLPEVSEKIRDPVGLGLVRDLFRKYVKKLMNIGGHDLRVMDLPDDPELLSSVVAFLMAVPIRQRQALLEETDIAALLSVQIELLEELTAAMEAEPEVYRAQPVNWEDYKNEAWRN